MWEEQEARKHEVEHPIGGSLSIVICYTTMWFETAFCKFLELSGARGNDYIRSGSSLECPVNVSNHARDKIRDDHIDARFQP